MRGLSLIILVLILLFGGKSTPKSPHGKDFKISCSVCHSASGWKLDKTIYSFDHNKTELPLEGQHTVADCKLCHPTLVFKDAGTECNNCHTDMHSQTVGMDCSRCHTPKSWIVTNISEIHHNSRFPLLGAHATADCKSCHKSESLLKFDPVGVECFDCHRDKYMATTKPNHLTSGFATECDQCHHVYSFEWGSSGFNHAFFPLTLGHSGQSCIKCHPTSNYASTSPECFSCHAANYNTTTNPNHLISNFSTDCKLCHTTNPGWKPASINHDFFPLTLGHNIKECAKCHKTPDYGSTSSICYDCHLSNYNSTKTPNHLTSQFPTDCKFCHTTNPGWKPATFDHDGPYFPIYSGKHAGTWNSCADCHTNPSNFKTNSCIVCHEHNKSDMDSKHDEVTNYSYNSAACFDCHPRGKTD